MRKLSICALASAAVLTMAGTAPITAQAAMSTYTIPGGKMVVIGGNSMGDLNSLLGQIQGNMQGGVQGNINFTGCEQLLQNCPSLIIPGQNCPHQNIPGQNYPGQNYPGQNNPGQNNPDQNNPGNPTPDQPGGNTSQDEYARQIVDLVNAERAKAGLQALAINNTAAGAALTRAKEIEISFSHTRPNGSAFHTALTAAGVSYRSAGENIAYGQKTPEQVMQDWMSSAGHRANILNANFTSIGVGHYRSVSGVDYWTQLFIN